MTGAELAAEIAAAIAQDSRLDAIREKIEAGTADLKDSEQYTAICAEITGRMMRGAVAGLDDREESFTEIARERYRETFDIYSAVQAIIDRALGIRIAAKEPGFQEDRARKIGHALEDQTVPESTILRRAESASENFVMSQHDRCVEENAKFRDRAGLQSYAVRTGGAKCCQWCADVSGKYPANETPDGFWGRHDNCKCSILYESRRGTQLLRGTGKGWNVVAEGAGAGELHRLSGAEAAAAGAPDPVVLTAEQAKAIQTEKGLTILPDGSILMLSDSGDPLFHVTNESFSAIPKVSAFDEEQLNQAVAEQCREILKSVQFDKVGTECTVSIRIRDLHTDCQKGGQGDGTVAPIKLNEPYISIHNHASNKTISPRDARMLALYSNCYAVVVIGNRGDKIYVLRKEAGFDADGLMKAVEEKIKPENSSITDDEFLRGCELYGTKYFG